MSIPRCNRCETDRFLKFTRASHAYVEHEVGDTEDLTASLTGDRNGPAGPVVHYFCQSCGTNDGHTVPEGWVQPPDDPDLEELRQRGEIWVTPNQRRVRKADGRWITTIEV